MYIIIAGCGKVGSNLAKELSRQNHNVAIIDNDPSSFEQLGSGFNGLIITGVPIDEDVLRSAGIEQADALAAVTPNDNTNMMISQIATKLFNVPKVITRVYDPDRDVVFQQLGLSTMCPTTLAVEQVKSVLNDDKQGIWQSFGNRNIRFRYLTVFDKQAGKHLKNIQNDYDGQMVFGIIRDGEFCFAQPHFRVAAGDILVIAE